MITVDDSKMKWERGLTVERLLERVKPDFPFFVVKVNGEHISRADYGTFVIPDGADVRIVYMIAGG